MSNRGLAVARFGAAICLASLSACRSAPRRDEAPVKREPGTFRILAEEFHLYPIGERVDRGELRYEVLRSYYVESDDGSVGHVCADWRVSNLTSNLRIPSWELPLPVLHDGERSYQVDDPLFSRLAQRDAPETYLDPGSSMRLVLPYRVAPGRYVVGTVPRTWSSRPTFKRRAFFFDLGDVRPTND